MRDLLYLGLGISLVVIAFGVILGVAEIVVFLVETAARAHCGAGQ